MRAVNERSGRTACLCLCMYACKCKFMYPWMHARTPAGFEIRRRARAAPQHLTQRSCDFRAPPSYWSRSQSLLSSQHATALPHHARLVRNGLDFEFKNPQPRTASSERHALVTLNECLSAHLRAPRASRRGPKLGWQSASEMALISDLIHLCVCRLNSFEFKWELTPSVSTRQHYYSNRYPCLSRDKERFKPQRHSVSIFSVLFSKAKPSQAKPRPPRAEALSNAETVSAASFLPSLPGIGSVVRLLD